MSDTANSNIQAKPDVEALKAVLCQKFEVELGKTIVTYKGKEFLVLNIYNYGFMKPWLDGVPRLKSGKWGTKQQCLYSHWEIVGRES